MNLEDLAAYGANVDEGLPRCAGKEELYLRLVDKVRGDDAFDALADALGAGRLRDAFEAAHGLKGSLGNLALAPLYEPMSELTELLRNETPADYAPLMEKIAAARDQLNAL